MGVVAYYYNPRIQRQEEGHKFQTSKYKSWETDQQLKNDAAFPKDMGFVPSTHVQLQGIQNPLNKYVN